LSFATKYVVETWHGGHHTGGTGFARLRWVVRRWHGPIAATHAGRWCDFDKRHRATARGTTVAISRPGKLLVC